MNIRDINYTIPVNGGNGVKFIPGLAAGEGILAYVSIADGNYSAYNTTTFNINPKSVSVGVSVGNIVYGEDTVVIVQSDVDGDYILNIRDVNYTVFVNGGTGVKFIPNLGVGNQILVTIKRNDNYTAFNKTTFNINQKQTNVEVAVENITWNESAIANIIAEIDGMYTLSVNNVEYPIEVIDGKASQVISGLAADRYVAQIAIVDGNYSAFNQTEFNVAPKPLSLIISVKNIIYEEKALVIVVSDVDGEYLVYVDDAYIVSVVDGMGGIAVDGLTVGTYVVDVTAIDDNYAAFNSTTFEVFKVDAEIDIDFENETSDTSSITLNLPEDATGNVSMYVNGKLSQTVSLVNGSAVIMVPNLVIGDNYVSVVYSGDDNYDSFNKSVVINRKATIMAFDMVRGYNSGLDYTAKLFDSNGSPLANTYVTIKVDTNIYTVQTDSYGVLNFNNKLAVGDYAIVIVNPINGEYKLTNLKIVNRITDNKDVSIFFVDGSNYKVRIVGDDGNYVGAGEAVEINVGGKTYSVVTDENGYANFKLSLKVKKYTITATYKGFTTNNKVTVKSVVKPLKKTVKVKNTAKKLKIKVKLKGKKVLKKKRVYLKFKGKTYKAKTNKKGVATFKVSEKVIKGLKKGKKYKAVFTYKAKAYGKTIKNTAKSYVKVV